MWELLRACVAVLCVYVPVRRRGLHSVSSFVVTETEPEKSREQAVE